MDDRALSAYHFFVADHAPLLARRGLAYAEVNQRLSAAYYVLSDDDRIAYDEMAFQDEERVRWLGEHDGDGTDFLNYFGRFVGPWKVSGPDEKYFAAMRRAPHSVPIDLSIVVNPPWVPRQAHGALGVEIEALDSAPAAAAPPRRRSVRVAALETAKTVAPASASAPPIATRFPLRVKRRRRPLLASASASRDARVPEPLAAAPPLVLPNVKVNCVVARLDGPGFEDYADGHATRSEAERQQPLGWLAKHPLPASTYIFRISGAVEHGAPRVLTDIDLTLHANTYVDPDARRTRPRFSTVPLVRTVPSPHYCASVPLP